MAIITSTTALFHGLNINMGDSCLMNGKQIPNPILQQIFEHCKKLLETQRNFIWTKLAQHSYNSLFGSNSCETIYRTLDQDHHLQFAHIRVVCKQWYLLTETKYQRLLPFLEKLPKPFDEVKT